MEQATKYLLALVKDKDSYVRGNAAYALGLAFLHLTASEQASKDLLVPAKIKIAKYERSDE